MWCCRHLQIIVTLSSVNGMHMHVSVLSHVPPVSLLLLPVACESAYLEHFFIRLQNPLLSAVLAIFQANHSKTNHDRWTSQRDGD